MCCGRNNFAVCLSHVATRFVKKTPYTLSNTQKSSYPFILNVHNAHILFEKIIRFKKIIYVSIKKIYAMSPSGHHKVSYFGMYIKTIINIFLLALS